MGRQYGGTLGPSQQHWGRDHFLQLMQGSATLGMVLLDMVISSTEIPQFVSGNLTHSHLRGLSTSR